MQRSCARGSPKRQSLFERRGTFQVRCCGPRQGELHRRHARSGLAPRRRPASAGSQATARLLRCARSRRLTTALPCPALYCLQVPYIEDPNTGVAMFESSAIVEYLEKTYGSSGSA